MRITGKYYEDENFVTVVTESEVYVIPHNDPENWGVLRIGEYTRYGVIFTREFLDSMRSECISEGTFLLKD